MTLNMKLLTIIVYIKHGELLTIIVYIKHGEFLPPPELDEIPVCSTDGEIMREETDANPLTIR